VTRATAQRRSRFAGATPRVTVQASRSLVSAQETLMRKRFIACIGCIALVLTGCGVETAGTAATAAAGRKQEVEQGRRTMEQAGARAAGAMDQAQERLRESDK
jgi:hypothetical protein